jgi:hypothetical protein
MMVRELMRAVTSGTIITEQPKLHNPVTVVEIKLHAFYK